MWLSRRVVLLALVTLAATSSSSVTVARATAACQTWQRVNAPQLSLTYLTSVAGTSSQDVWAVGGKSYGPSIPPIFHWDGHSWKGSQIEQVDATLNDVSADAVNDAWAVGPYGPAGAPIMHWDGTSWQLVQSIASEYLYGVVAIDPADVWAVGYSLHHWDGTTWSLSATSQGLLYDVAAVSPTDVWAVGYAGYRTSPLAEHWDGVAWTAVPVPSPPGSGAITLESVAAVSTNDVWATGYYGSLLNPLIEHWDGVAWSIVPIASPSGLNLSGVAATSATDAWTVGGWRKISEHWDGSTWTAFAYQGPTQAYLSAVVEMSPTDSGGYGW